MLNAGLLTACSLATRPERLLDDPPADAGPSGVEAGIDQGVTGEGGVQSDGGAPLSPPWGRGRCLEAVTTGGYDNVPARFTPLSVEPIHTTMVAAAGEDQALVLLLEAEDWLCVARLSPQLEVVETFDLPLGDRHWPLPRRWHVVERPEGVLFLSLGFDEVQWVFVPEGGAPWELGRSPGVDHPGEPGVPLPIDGVHLQPFWGGDGVEVARWLDGDLVGRVELEHDGGIYARLLRWGERRFVSFHRVEGWVIGPFLIEVDSRGHPIGPERLIGPTGNGSGLIGAPLGDRFLLLWDSYHAWSVDHEQLALFVDQELEPQGEPRSFDDRRRVGAFALEVDRGRGVLAYYDQQRCCEPEYDLVIRRVDGEGVRSSGLELPVESPSSLGVIRAGGRWFVLWNELFDLFVMRLS